MIAHEFKGKYGLKADTPEGGSCSFAIGYMRRDPDSDEEPAAYLNIVDQEGSTVAEFAMTPGCFGVVTDLMKHVIERVQDTAHEE